MIGNSLMDLLNIYLNNIKMIKTIALLGLLTTLTFTTALGQMTGNYKSAEYNFFERGLLYLKGVDSFIGGMDLTLESDSNFQLITCSVIETGKWSVKLDSLHLEVYTRESRSDSVNNAENKPDWLKEPFRSKSYEIINDGFYREIYLKDKKKGKISAADKLIRNNLP